MMARRKIGPSLQLSPDGGAGINAALRANFYG